MLSVKRIQEIMQEGREAYKNGIKQNKCPYPFYMRENVDLWKTGWMFARMEQDKKQN